jgi:hypothetical protein
MNKISIKNDNKFALPTYYGYRSRIIEEFQILGFVEKGWITGPSGAPYGSAGIIVNCPIVYRFL